LNCFRLFGELGPKGVEIDLEFHPRIDPQPIADANRWRSAIDGVLRERGF
jgi:hypothetical protein